ncbi:HAD-IA family hydrolase, partial [Candidatus Micrarchaeota archaeon]|nr:HAD-IA family hydrolase [Candidatus Micrarchaeota archaeon]
MLRAVLFDLDGVIVDSAKANLLLYRSIMKEFGFKEPGKKKFAPLAAYGSKRTIQCLLPYGHRKDEKLLEKMRARMKIIAPNFIKYIKLSENARSLIRGLSRDYFLAVVTNRRKSTFKILARFGLLNYFDVVITADGSRNIKPHPAPLLKALNKLKVKNNEAIFIGDSEVDRVAGK